MQSTLRTLAVLAAVPFTLAQTFTDCNPLSQTCPADTALSQSTFNTDFTSASSMPTGWSALTGTTLTYGSNGAVFQISEAGQAPTIQSDFYIFFGTIEVVMQAAPGTGIVSSVVFESDDLDEVDWEFVGPDTSHAQSNYYGKGNHSTYNRVVYEDVTSPQTEFHTYGFDWNADRIIWSIDGQQVRTLEYADALGGQNYPQTPMRIKIGNWAGGCPTCPAGTASWAGGYTDYSQGPFTMYVKSIQITNANPAAQYKYGDETGSWQSIEVIDSAGNTLDTDSTSSGGSGSSSNQNSSSGSASTSASGSGSASASSSASASASATAVSPSTHTHTKTNAGTSSGAGSSSSSPTTPAINGANPPQSTGFTSSTAPSNRTSSTTSPAVASQTGGGASLQAMASLSLFFAAAAIAFVL